ncbi:T9SS type A sorting domain-containing protein [Fluviicola sp.]|uniref:T9SS type A sorting domain-containing protein n=1 Tax=Fluviicola sp. TaxID=1917219 RepID=UPI00261F379A|nr:T9SS type A sorting domain-containing protein [Fluviicola sp.]
MKRTLLSLSIISLCFLANAQRSVDLQLEVTSHSDGDFIITEGPIDFTGEVSNAGTETLEAADSVYYYIIVYIDGFTDSIPLSFGAGSAAIYTGIPYFQGQSFTATHTIGFSAGFNGEPGELCVYGKPVNRTNPISDPVLVNNKQCVSVTFIDEADLSVGENKSDKIQLSPNPSNTCFSIKNVEENSVLSITDLNGNAIGFTQNAAHQIDCSGWKNGIYLVFISDSKGNFVERMVVSH